MVADRKPYALCRLLAVPTLEYEQIARMGITLEHFLHQQGEADKALAHISVAGGQPHAPAGRDRDHGRLSTTCNTLRSASASTSRSTRTRRPCLKTISITPVRRGRDATGVLCATGVISTGMKAGPALPIRPTQASRRQVKTTLGASPWRRAASSRPRSGLCLRNSSAAGALCREAQSS